VFQRDLFQLLQPDSTSQQQETTADWVLFYGALHDRTI
jgi:hypothetical protein